MSGEPENWQCDEAGTATVEDGTFAAMALRGQPIPWCKRIVSDVRWNYGPHTDVQRIECGPRKDGG